MMGLSLLVLGGAMIVGRLLYRAPAELPPSAPPDPDVPPPSRDEREAAEDNEARALDRNLTIAGVGTGAAVAGVLIFPPANVLALGCIAYNVVPLAGQAWRIARDERRLSIEALDLCSISIAVGARLYPLAALAGLVYFGSCSLLDRARRRTRGALADAWVEHPGVAWLRRGGVTVQVGVDTLAPGDVIVVNAGEAVPVDGRVVGGAGGVDQRALTGESLPEDKAPGDRVFATTLLLSGRLEVEVEQAGVETVARQISRTLDRTQRFEARLVEGSVREADATVAPSIGVAGVALVGLGIPAALAVLSANYMDVARIATPLTMLSHLGLAEEAGLLVMDGRSLEQIGTIDTFVFDKTGTLTLDAFTVADVRLVGDHPLDEVVALAASAEAHQTHPIARAIVGLAQARGLSPPTADFVETVVGHGLGARVAGQRLLIGSMRHLRACGVDVEPPADADARSMVGLAIDGCLAAWFVLEARLRPEVPGLIGRLKARGARVYILSGDHPDPTHRLGERLGVDGALAEVLPGDKAAFIRRLQGEGRSVCFVGDGINDAIALKCANLSVSIHGASALALDNAQVVLLDPGLSGLDALIALGERFDRDLGRAMVGVRAPTLLATGAVLVLHLGLVPVTAGYALSAALGGALGLLPRLGGSARRPAGEAPAAADAAERGAPSGETIAIPRRAG